MCVYVKMYMRKKNITSFNRFTALSRSRENFITVAHANTDGEENLFKFFYYSFKRDFYKLCHARTQLNFFDIFLEFLVHKSDKKIFRTVG